MNNSDVIVIGGGASGMMAALFAARGGASVRLLERNEKLGKKIYITGKGRCNLTNSADHDTFMRQIMRNPRFCYAALSFFDNAALMDLIRGQGVPLKEERGGRMFPVSDHASDVTKALERAMQRAGVKVALGARVTAIRLDESGAACGVTLDNGQSLDAAAVIVATGGQSYPTTGSTGDGWRFAEASGHRTRPALPALTGIETRETWPAGLSGLTLKNVALTAHGPKKKPLYREQGELLMTHFGISGPLALTLSSVLPEDCEGIRLSIDLKPALDEATLDQRILRDVREASRKQMASIMDGLTPHALGQVVLTLSGVPADLPANALTQPMRRALVATIKALPLTVKGLRGLDEAIVTRGGVVVGDIDPSTMASKKVPGLYFAGETIDIDALTGGFNLQLAFSTGALAGHSAAARVCGPNESISEETT